LGSKAGVLSSPSDVGFGSDSGRRSTGPTNRKGLSIAVPLNSVIASQRVGANGSRECAPDDRLRAAPAAQNIDRIERGHNG
jgi:hypothetical protein